MFNSMTRTRKQRGRGGKPSKRLNTTQENLERIQKLQPFNEVNLQNRLAMQYNRLAREAYSKRALTPNTFRDPKRNRHRPTATRRR